MRKAGIAIAFIFAFWGCFGFAQVPPAPTEKNVSTHAQSASAGGSGKTSDSLEAMTDIHDIKPLVSVPVPVSWTDVALWAAVCIAAIALLLGAWFLWRRRRGPSVETVEAILSPEETALQRLSNLSTETGMEGKLFYFQLSFIFREYLQGRFGIDGLEMTTEELLPYIETVPIDRDLKQNSKKFILSSDPVKYADAPAFRELMSADFTFVKSFVEKTAATVQDQADTAGVMSAGSPE